MRVRVVGQRRHEFGDAAPTVALGPDSSSTAPMSLTPDLSTLEVFVLAGVITHIAVRLIDKAWK